MRGQRRGAEGAALVAGDAGLDHDAAMRTEQAGAAKDCCGRARRSSAHSAEGRLPAAVWVEVWPAFCAARSTWLMKLFCLGARVERMRPGRTRKSRSPSLIAASLEGPHTGMVPDKALKTPRNSLGAARAPTDWHAKSHAQAMAYGEKACRFYLAL